MRIVSVIPARYGSTRFPGKLLAKKTGKYLIQHVYEQVKQAKMVNSVLIATDDCRIGDACDEFGCPWKMTRNDHISGTDRIAEVAHDLDADIIINVQGDEPDIDPKNIDILARLLTSDNKADMATLSATIKTTGPANNCQEILANPDCQLNNPNVVKLITDINNHAIYFSRWPIPFNRDGGATSVVYRKHIGIYAYRKEALLKLSILSPTPLELSEKLEQLRAIENGMTIAVGNVEHLAVGIDTPQQYEDFVNSYTQ